MAETASVLRARPDLLRLSRTAAGRRYLRMSPRSRRERVLRPATRVLDALSERAYQAASIVAFGTRQPTFTDLLQLRAPRRAAALLVDAAAGVLASGVNLLDRTVDERVAHQRFPMVRDDPAFGPTRRRLRMSADPAPLTGAAPGAGGAQVLTDDELEELLNEADEADDTGASPKDPGHSR